jgi:uncharacterized membrane protein (UPF0127 family)
VRSIYQVCLLALTVLVAGCGGKNQPATSTVANVDPDEPTAAQPRLRTLPLWIGPRELTTELAMSQKEIRTGMMFRTNIAENEAMLFVLGVPQKTAFWMKNTRVPLSVAYIDPAGVILEIHDLKPFDTNSVIADASNIQYALETAQGWFERNGIGVGTPISTDRGPLPSVFFGR